MVKKLIIIFKQLKSFEKKNQIGTTATLIFLSISVYYLRADNDFLKSESKRFEIELVSVKEQKKSLMAAMILYNRSFKEYPDPIWQKVKRGNEFILQYANPKYIDVFGHIFGYNIYNVIGKNNFELGYPKDIAQLYFDYDMEVALTGKVLKDIEFYPDSVGIIRKLTIKKWRDIRDRDTLIYGKALIWNE